MLLLGRRTQRPPLTRWATPLVATSRISGSVQHPNPDPPQHRHRHHRQGQHSEALKLFLVHRLHFVRTGTRPPSELFQRLCTKLVQPSAHGQGPPRRKASPQQPKRALPGPMGHLGDTSLLCEVSGRIFNPKALQHRDLWRYLVAFESIRK